MEWCWVGLLVVCVTPALIYIHCHCSTTELCDTFLSTPCSQMDGEDMCQRGWFGLYCQKQNIALRSSCSQSSNLYNNANDYGAGLGVDGRATTDAHRSPLTCAHTMIETNPTWTVNLNTSVLEKIQHIRLYLRGDDCEFIHTIKMVVVVSNGASK
ncbi:uncharacterized protein LOC124270065 [Haliotis rubra]|uniref:uncharacterized protein LOC124270065 n=1 Tax=Haliotis rubra TaxID=36100 RepID=UPI001EE55573|nr:uncharacterized protein LOC124270065 [Haliotis rubra]